MELVDAVRSSISSRESHNVETSSLKLDSGNDLTSSSATGTKHDAASATTSSMLSCNPEEVYIMQ